MLQLDGQRQLTALACLVVGGGVERWPDCDRVALGGLDGVCGLLERLAGHDPVDVCAGVKTGGAAAACGTHR